MGLRIILYLIACLQDLVLVLETKGVVVSATVAISFNI